MSAPILDPVPNCSRPAPRVRSFRALPSRILPSRISLARIVVLGLGVAAFAMSAAQAGAGPGEFASLFGTHEFKTENLAPFPKWTGVLDRYQAETAGDSCNSGSARCGHDRWQRFIADQQRKPPLDQIRAVNREFNRYRYVLDPVNYGVPDYWATPFQFLRLNGDCEDYAITKFMALRALGFDNDALRIVVLRDLNLKLAHAILVVYYEDRVLVLDNQISDIVEATAIRHYRPIYSVNESAWWLHRP